jgi:hypothetical protein
MSLKSLAIIAGSAIALILPAEAFAAYTTGSVNLRTGPGTGYGIITTIPGGAAVGVGSCVPSWCQVNYAGFNGWVSTALLGDVGQPAYPPPPAYVPPPAYAYAPPPVYPYYAPYYYGPSFGFYFGGHPWHHHW